MSQIDKILQKVREVVKKNPLRIKLTPEQTRKIELDNDSALHITDPDTGIIISSNGSPAANEFIRGYAHVIQASKEEEELWISELRARGICGAHPDDGHVDRERKLVTLMYPQFWDPCTGQGDKIALGWPWQYRIVKLKEAAPWKYASVFLGKEIQRFRFEEVKEDE